MVRWLLILLTIALYQVLPILTISNSLGIVLGKVMDKFYTDSTRTIAIQISSNSTVAYRIQSDLANAALASRQTMIPVVCNHNQHMVLSLSYYNLFLVESYHSFHSLYKTLNPRKYDFTGRFTVVYSKGLSQIDNPIALMFKDMWRKHILNAIVIIPGETSAEVHSYFPYRPGSCGNADPVMTVNISFADDDFDINLFPNHLTNMHGCLVKAGMYPLKPFTIIESNANNETIYKGTEVDIVKAAAKVHNFTIEFRQPANGVKWGFIRDANSTGLMKLIQSETVDLGFGSVGLTVKRNLYLKPGVSHLTSTVVFAVPPGRLYTSFEKLYKPFTSKAWTLLGVAFTIGMFAAKLLFSGNNANFLRIFNIETLQTPLLNMWSQILGIPLARLPKKSITLAIAIGWMITGLLVRTLYQGVMFKYLHAGEQTKSVQTLEDFNSAGLHYYMYDVYRRFFATSPDILSRTKQIKEFEDADVKLRQLLRRELDGVLVLPAAMVAYFNQKNAGREHVKIGADIVSTYIVCIYYPMNSPLPEIFDVVILNLQSSGIISYWRAKYGDILYNEILIRELAPLKMDSISGTFMIWLLLLTFCTVVFGIELVYGKCLKLAGK